MKKIVVGITGASGSILGKYAVEQLLASGHEVHLVLTDQGKKVFPFELDISIAQWHASLPNSKHFYLHDNDNLFSALASGSYPVDGTLIIPCSMGTLGKVASGISDSLLTRACDVAIKEKRNIVMVTRETPLSSIHLENMLKLSKAGVIIMPPVPSFYNKPKNLEESILHTVARVLGLLGIENSHKKEWGDPYHSL